MHRRWPYRDRLRGVWRGAALCAAINAAPAAPGQETDRAIASQIQQPPATAAPASAPVNEDAQADPLAVFRAPLLREGSTLVEALASLKRDSDGDWWSIVIEPRDARSPAYELIPLPCTRLSEMERIIEAADARGDDGDVRFRVSGRAYVFRDRNYFLPTHAAVVSDMPSASSPAAESARSPAVAVPATQAAAVTSPSTRVDDESQAEDDSAEAIARRLAEDAGPIVRSSGIARDTASDMPPETARANPTRGGYTNHIALDTSDRDGANARATVPENTAVVNRRGKITRDRSGGWLLVLDADATGLSDPPYKLLPCMLLQDIEDYARRGGNNSPIIVTGQVYLYNGQNHLLPTVYRIPRETSRITP